MGTESSSRLRSAIVLLGLGAAACWAANTAQPVVPAAGTSAGSGCRDGYRRVGSMLDFTLGRGWLIYANCDHPEMPRQAVADGEQARLPPGVVARPQAFRDIPKTPGTVLADPILNPVVNPVVNPVSAPAPAVAAGARVRVWKRDAVAAIDLAGVALESGRVGAEIRVRIDPGGKVLRGTVRGAGSVELAVPDTAGFRGEGQ